MKSSDNILRYSKYNNVWFILHNTLTKEVLDGKSFSKKWIKRIGTKHRYKNKNVICVSKGVKDDFLNNFYVKGRVIQIYNPVDTNLLEQLSKCDLPGALPANYIVHVGKFKQAKRQDRLIRAFALLNTSLKLIFVGNYTNNNCEYLECLQLAKTLNIEDRVIFYGDTANPYPIIKNAKLLTLSSDFEGLGMVLLEAIFIGTPVVSTDCHSGPSEILGEKHQHCLAKLDEKSLAEKMQAALNNPQKYTPKIQSKFTMQEVSNKYNQLVQSEEMGGDLEAVAL